MVNEHRRRPFNDKTIAAETAPTTEIFSLEQIVDPGREVPAQYQRLIALQDERSDSRFLETAYADNWGALLHPKTAEEIQAAHQDQELLKPHLTGSALVDLGGGYSSFRRIATALGAQAYINVDRGRFGKGSAPDPLRPLQADHIVLDNKEFDLVAVKADMLDFVARLRSGSVDFTLNGIDLMPVNDLAYHEALAREMVRATRVQGIILGIDSEALNIIERQIKTGAIKNVRQLQLATNFGLLAKVFVKIE